MRISELAHELNELKDRQGDLEVVVNYDVQVDKNPDKVYTPEHVIPFSPNLDKAPKWTHPRKSNITYALIE